MKIHHINTKPINISDNCTVVSAYQQTMNYKDGIRIVSTCQPSLHRFGRGVIRFSYKVKLTHYIERYLSIEKYFITSDLKEFFYEIKKINKTK